MLWKYVAAATLRNTEITMVFYVPRESVSGMRDAVAEPICQAIDCIAQPIQFQLRMFQHAPLYT